MLQVQQFAFQDEEKDEENGEREKGLHIQIHEICLILPAGSFLSGQIRYSVIYGRRWFRHQTSHPVV